MQTTAPVTADAVSDEPQSGSRFVLCCVFLVAMEAAYLFLAAVLPLYGVWFHTSLSADLSPWFLLPARMLFAKFALNPTIFHLYQASPPTAPTSWQGTGLLLLAFTLLFAVYLLALRYMRKLVTRRLLILSLLLFGATCSLIPIVTSTDVFSYIAYARLGILYHLNPLTAIPTAIRSDPVYVHLYWINQPSAYGPIFALVTGALQWVLGIFGRDNVAQMVLALRLLGLGAHIWSTLLVWSIIGAVQRTRETYAPELRVLATFAFAWNPLLLFEACVNAHVDTLVLLFVLLAFWALVRAQSSTFRSFAWVAVFFALATCLKVNVVLLMPGILLFLWAREQRLQPVALFTALYAAIIVVLYAPFWQGGALLAVLHANPGTYRAINTLPEFLANLYNSLAHLFGAPPTSNADSPAEALARTLSILIFLVLYGLLCARALTTRYKLSTIPALLRWMVLAWLLYCAFGSPWFWPWYSMIFFGLVALLAGSAFGDDTGSPLRLPFSLSLLSPVVLLFSFSLLSLYCFYTWAPYATFLPGLALFRWAFLRSLWVWLLPLLAMIVSKRKWRRDRQAIPSRKEIALQAE